MACLTRYTEAADFAAMWCIDISDPATVASIELHLNLAAGLINVARQATGGCNCTLSTGSVSYLNWLNSLIAAVILNCPCANVQLDAKTKMEYISWARSELRMIRTGEIELCEGETATDFPVVDWAEMNLTAPSQAQMIYNSFLRSLP